MRTDGYNRVQQLSDKRTGLTQKRGDPSYKRWRIEKGSQGMIRVSEDVWFGEKIRDGWAYLCGQRRRCEQVCESCLGARKVLMWGNGRRWEGQVRTKQWGPSSHVKSFGLYHGLRGAMEGFQAKKFDHFCFVDWWLRRQHGEWWESKSKGGRENN